jgi:hypothetical protein
MSAENESWYYAKEGARQGPVSGDALRAAFERGDIASGTLVWKNGMEAWQAAKDTGLSTLLFATPPPLPSEVVRTSPQPVIQSPPLPPSTDGPPIIGGRFWFEPKLGRWRAQRLVGATLMVTLCVTWGNSERYSKVPHGGSLVLALGAGLLAFSATRKLHVAAQFKRTGLKRLRLKAELRTLGSVLIYAILIGAIGGLASDGYGGGFAAGLIIASLAYGLTIFSSSGAVRQCRIEPLIPPAPAASWFEGSLGFWRAQWIIGIAFMLGVCVIQAYFFHLLGTGKGDPAIEARIQRTYALVYSFLALAPGCLAFVALRKLHVVAQFKRTGTEGLLMKAALRSLASVGVYILILAGAEWLACPGLPPGAWITLCVPVLSYALTFYSTLGAVRKCRGESAARRPGI